MRSRLKGKLNKTADLTAGLILGEIPDLSKSNLENKNDKNDNNDLKKLKVNEVSSPFPSAVTLTLTLSYETSDGGNRDGG